MKKGWKIAGIVIIVVVLLFFGVQWWLGYKIRKVIEEQVAEQTKGAVAMEIGEVNVRLIGRTVRLRDIHVDTDSSRGEIPEIPLDYLKGDIKEIVVKGIHYKKEDSVVSIRAREFGLDIPDMIAGVEKKSTSPSSGKPENSQSLATHLQIDKINIRLGKVILKQYDAQDTVLYDLKDFQSRIEGYAMKMQPDHSPVFSCGDLELSFAVFRNLFAQQSQLLQVDSFRIEGKEGRLDVAAVNLLPQYSRDEFALKAPGHTDWTKITTGRISCRGIDMQSMIKERILNIDSVSVSSAKIASFKNRKIEQAKRVKRLFYESVQEFPLPLTVRRIRLNDIHVEYQELAEKGLSPGTVTFDRLEGMFYGLTNIVRPAQPYFTLKARGELMGQGALEATFKLPVDSLNPHFEVKGSLGKMSLPALNPMIEPLVKVSIVSGEVEEMKFLITGNSMKEKVEMEFLYKGLKIRVMREKDGHLKVSSFLTTLANGLIAKENNPDHRGIRQAVGTAERDIYRSQFNYLWRALLEGLKISIGL